MALSVTFHPLAIDDLFGLYSYIEDRSGPARAGAYIDRIEASCRTLTAFPNRGTDRPDLGADIRTLSLERRLLIAYRTAVDTVAILRILYGGRDYSADDLPP